MAGNKWQERPPVDMRTPYSTVSWSSASWVCDAETQTLPLQNLVSEVLTAMVKEHLKSKGLPLIACPHTRRLQLENIINGIVESHRVTCTQPMQQECGSSKATTTVMQQQRKRPLGDSKSGALPERKKIKRAPKGTLYPCAKCSRTFSMQKDLIKHYNTVHSLSRPFKCDRCESWFKTNPDRSKHINGVHLNLCKFYCSICNKGCNSKNRLVEHENSHLKDEDRPIKCKYCNKGFPSTKDLKVHVRTHEVETKVKCELCTARFVSFNCGYKTHMKLIHKAHVRFESNKCLLCDKEFGELKQRPLLMEHMKEKHSDVGIVCKSCGRKFATASKLIDHEYKEHVSLSMSDPKKVKQRPRLRARVKKTKLATHEQREHITISMSTYNPKKVAVSVGDVSRELLMCQLCGGMFALRSALDQHLPIHFKNEDALSNEELAEIVDMQLEAAITSSQLSKTATKSLIEKPDSYSHLRKSSKKKKSKRLKMPRSHQFNTVIVNHPVNETGKTYQSWAPKSKNGKESEKGVVQIKTEVSNLNDGRVRSKSNTVEQETRDNMQKAKVGSTCTNTLSQSQKRKVETKYVEKSLQLKNTAPEYRNTLADTPGQMYAPAPSHLTLEVVQSANQSIVGNKQPEISKPESSMRHGVAQSTTTIIRVNEGNNRVERTHVVEIHQTEATKQGNNLGHTAVQRAPMVRHSNEDNNQVDNKQVEETRQSKVHVTKPGIGKNVEEQVEKGAEERVGRSTTTANEAKENQHDSSKTGQLENTAKVCRKPHKKNQSEATEPENKDNMREGVVCSATKSSQSQKGEVKSKHVEKSLQPEIRINRNQLAEMIRTGKITLSLKGPVTKVQTPPSGQTSSSACMQRTSGKIPLLVDSKSTPGIINKTVAKGDTTANDGKAASSSKSDTKASSSSKSDTKAASSSESDAKAVSSSESDTKAASSKSDTKTASSSKSDTKAASSSKSDPKTASSSKSDNKAASSSKSDNKAASSSKSDNKAASSSKSDNKAASSSKSDNKAASSSKSDNKAVSSSKSDNKAAASS
ncbi:uncharacterized protein [Amphiura filiformis]|uniref:uncharacterized protein n=1 Tax=Amphiura filiformis TaxID=82378 RepID=UPI003B2225A4